MTSEVLNPVEYIQNFLDMRLEQVEIFMTQRTEEKLKSGDTSGVEVMERQLCRDVYIGMVTPSTKLEFLEVILEIAQDEESIAYDGKPGILRQQTWSGANDGRWNSNGYTERIRHNAARDQRLTPEARQTLDGNEHVVSNCFRNLRTEMLLEMTLSQNIEMRASLISAAADSIGHYISATAAPPTKSHPKIDEMGMILQRIQSYGDNQFDEKVTLIKQFYNIISRDLDTQGYSLRGAATFLAYEISMMRRYLELKEEYPQLSVFERVILGVTFQDLDRKEMADKISSVAGLSVDDTVLAIEKNLLISGDPRIRVKTAISSHQ